MRRIQSRGLVRALEEEQVVEAATIAAEMPADDLNAAESLETELLEVQDSVEEGAVQEEQVEQAVEVSEALDEYQEALESIIGQGGLDRNGAWILQIGLEHLCARVGIEAGGMAMPSMESFGGSSSRVLATESALNSVKETAKQVWEAIVAAIQRAAAWVVDFFKKLVDSNYRLQKRAETILAAVKTTSGDVAEKEIENAALVEKLNISGQVGGDFAKQFEGAAKFLDNASKRASKEVYILLSGIVQDLKPGSTKIEIDVNAVRQAYTAFGLSAAPESDGFAKVEGLTVERSAQLPGGKALLVEQPQVAGVEGAKAFAKAKVYVGPFKANAPKVSATKLPVLSQADITAVANSVVEIAAGIKEFEKQQATVTDLLNKVGSVAKGWASANVEDKAEQAAIKAVLSSMGSKLTKLPSVLGSYAMNTSKAALDYAELSLKQYGKSTAVVAAK